MCNNKKPGCRLWSLWSTSEFIHLSAAQISISDHLLRFSLRHTTKLFCVQNVMQLDAGKHTHTNFHRDSPKWHFISQHMNNTVLKTGWSSCGHMTGEVKMQRWELTCNIFYVRSILTHNRSFQILLKNVLRQSVMVGLSLLQINTMKAGKKPHFWDQFIFLGFKLWMVRTNPHLVRTFWACK